MLYWDRPIITNKTIDFNRPDILLIDKVNKKALIIDIGVPLTHNLSKVEAEKRRKYQNLAIEVQRIWKLNSVKIIPLIISVEGVMSKQLKAYLKEIGLPNGIKFTMQKAAILQTCHLVRKFLTF